ncbi:hypothetical protein KIPB_006351, partial [Kipferlia bialata]
VVSLDASVGTTHADSAVLETLGQFPPAPLSQESASFLRKTNPGFEPWWGRQITLPTLCHCVEYQLGSPVFQHLVPSSPGSTGTLSSAQRFGGLSLLIDHTLSATRRSQRTLAHTLAVSAASKAADKALQTYKDKVLTLELPVATQDLMDFHAAALGEAEAVLSSIDGLPDCVRDIADLVCAAFRRVVIDTKKGVAQTVVIPDTQAVTRVPSSAGPVPQMRFDTVYSDLMSDEFPILTTNQGQVNLLPSTTVQSNRPPAPVILSLDTTVSEHDMLTPSCLFRQLLERNAAVSRAQSAELAQRLLRELQVLTVQCASISELHRGISGIMREYAGAAVGPMAQHVGEVLRAACLRAERDVVARIMDVTRLRLDRYEEQMKVVATDLLRLREHVQRNDETTLSAQHGVEELQSQVKRANVGFTARLAQHETDLEDKVKDLRLSVVELAKSVSEQGTRSVQDARTIMEHFEHIRTALQTLDAGYTGLEDTVRMTQARIADMGSNTALQQRDIALTKDEVTQLRVALGAKAPVLAHASSNATQESGVAHRDRESIAESDLEKMKGDLYSAQQALALERDRRERDVGDMRDDILRLREQITESARAITTGVLATAEMSPRAERERDGRNRASGLQPSPSGVIPPWAREFSVSLAEMTSRLSESEANVGDLRSNLIKTAGVMARLARQAVVVPAGKARVGCTPVWTGAGWGVKGPEN